MTVDFAYGAQVRERTKLYRPRDWVRTYYCYGGTRSGTDALNDNLAWLYATTTLGGLYHCKLKPSGNEYSRHADGAAIDRFATYMVGWAMCELLVTLSTALRLQQVIFYGWTWGGSDLSGWEPSDDPTDHDDHVHIELDDVGKMLSRGAVDAIIRNYIEEVTMPTAEEIATATCQMLSTDLPVAVSAREAIARHLRQDTRLMKEIWSNPEEGQDEGALKRRLDAHLPKL